MKTIEPPKLIFIAGGSGAGKSTIAASLHCAFGGTPLTLDDYFLNEESVPFVSLNGIGLRRDWDNPASLDFPLAKSHIEAYISNSPITVPVYDFAKNLRTSERTLAPAKFPLIVEGLFALSLASQCDLAGASRLGIFVTAPIQLRKERILERDAAHRSRSVEEFESRFAFILFGESRWMDFERQLADWEICTESSESIVSRRVSGVNCNLTNKGLDGASLSRRAGGGGGEG